MNGCYARISVILRQCSDKTQAPVVHRISISSPSVRLQSSSPPLYLRSVSSEALEYTAMEELEKGLKGLFKVYKLGSLRLCRSGLALHLCISGEFLCHCVSGELSAARLHGSFLPLCFR
ncbi:hypothetical protein Bca4012_024926 [Brassica carinata]